MERSPAVPQRRFVSKQPVTPRVAVLKRRRLARKQSNPQTPDKDLPGGQSAQSTYEGPKDAEGLPHGTGRLSHPDLTYAGDFVHGVREGAGELKVANGNMLCGNFKAGHPDGWCTLFNAGEKSTVRGHFVAGKLHGLAEKYDQEGRLVLRGSFAADAPAGVAEVFDVHGGRLIGAVDPELGMSGEELVYVFPDGQTALVGAFGDAELQSGRYAKLREGLAKPPALDPEEDIASWTARVHEVTVPPVDISDAISEDVYQDVSTETTVSLQPLVPDLYEVERVEVRQCATTQTDGLFARKQISAGELCSWYTGLRRSAEEAKGSTGTIMLDEEVVLEMPPELSSSERFCACLGHKAKHASPGNAQYDVFDHPRFGMIKAVRATKDIEPGEEICCDHGRQGDPKEMVE